MNLSLCVCIEAHMFALLRLCTRVHACIHATVGERAKQTTSEKTCGVDRSENRVG